MLKAFIVKSFTISILKAPLIEPFRTAKGEHKFLENVLFEIKFQDGTIGRGEAAIASHITGETVDGSMKNLRVAGEYLIGKEACDYLKISSALHEMFPDNKAVVCALEMSLLDALTKKWNIPLYRFFGNSCKHLTTDITIVISDLARTEEASRKFYKQGFRMFKVKIGGDFDSDVKRVLIVKKFTPKAKIFLDANQGFSANETLRFLRELNHAKVFPELIEQPVPKEDWEGLKRVTRISKTPVCADESVRSIDDCVRLIREKAAQMINIKLMKFGVIHAREIAQIARANGIDLVIGSMLESGFAVSAAAHMAAGLGCFKYVDLDTPFYIKNGLNEMPQLNCRGVYDMRSAKPGIGIKIQ